MRTTPTGNPPGRPRKGTALSDTLRVQLGKRTVDPDDGKLRSNWVQVAKTLVRAARTGDVKAIGLIFDRLEGKAREKHELSGPDGGLLTFTISLGEPDEEDEGDA